MQEAAPTQTSDNPIEKAINLASIKCRVRSSPGGYTSVLFFATLAAGFLAQLNFVWASLILLACAWTTFPVLLWFDRIEFDGKSIKRTGLIFILRRLMGAPRRLKIADVEAIETSSLRALRRGGLVYYRYRCEIFGDGQSFVLSSGGKNFRRMIKIMFPLVDEEKLDARSLELRDFLTESSELNRKIKNLNLPSSDALENTLPRSRGTNKRLTNKPNFVPLETAAENSTQNSTDIASTRLNELRQTANELRIAGNLAQSIEAFRRALLHQPQNAGVLYEFARSLHSYAGVMRSAVWQRRATAALRLAAARAGQNAQLLVRIGETHLQFNDFTRATKLFRRALEIEIDNFRAECGLAEIGLQDGKIAHVVHHYQAAARAAKDHAARAWANGEAEYFSLLNNNADYTDVEISRINWLANFARSKRISLRLLFVGLIVILSGVVVDESVAIIGWAIAATATIVWAGSSLAENFLTDRFPPLDDDDE